MPRPIASALLTGLSSTCLIFAEDMPNPAFQAQRESTSSTPSGETRTTHSWEMPAITVSGRANSGLREEDRIGSYEQPRWTARRLWGETRSYVVPEGQIEFEYWLIVQERKRGDKDGEGKIKHQYEVEMGLPYRFQIDLYQTWEKEGDRGPMDLSETKFEVRWALANWGVIPANPTLYVEWANVNGGYDVIEGKLLLCDELTSRWHWGTNFVWEEETGGAKERALEMTNALSYTLVDQRFSLGAEAKWAFIDVAADRGDYEKEFLLGPSAQYRPQPQMHINLAVLAGLTDESPVTKTTMVAGWEF